MESQQGIFFKYGERRYIDRFAAGELFMRPLEEFVKGFEHDSVRGDNYEGVTALIQASGAMLQIQVEDRWEKVGTLGGPIRHTHDRALSTNVFCLYALPGMNPIEIDPRVRQFGDALAVIRNCEEFIERVRSAASARYPDQTLEHGLVAYVDESSYNGPIGPFRKRKLFEYQREYRIALLPGTGAPLTLDVGDLSDLVTILNSDIENERMRFFDTTLGVICN